MTTREDLLIEIGNNYKKIYDLKENLNESLEISVHNLNKKYNQTVAIRY